MSELNSNLRNSSHLSASFLKTWKCSQWRCLQNEYGVENTLGIIDYSFTLFCMKNYFILKAVSSSLPWQARQCGLQNLKKQREFKYLKQATVNWLLYFMFQTCFMTCKTLQFCWNDCSVWAEVNVKEQLSPLIEFISFWRRENAQIGVVYRARTVLRYSWDYKLFILFILHEELFCFEGRVVEFAVL